MKTGAFSISLAVKDLAASSAFYKELGFSQFAGEADLGWLILQNEACTIGLFQGMFERNMLTFNPGWDSKARPVAEFTDVRDIQRKLRAANIPLVTEVDETTSGPGNFVVADPDGNPVLFDQHV